MIRNNIRKSSCPTETEQFDSHAFVGRKVIPVFGWDFSNFIVTPGTDDINIEITNDLGSTSTFIGAGSMDGLLGKVCDVYNVLMGSLGDSTILSYALNGTYGYFILTGTNVNNSQLAIQNNTTSVWGNPLGIDPDGDSLNGEPPYLFNIVNLDEPCKLLPVTSKEFDCTTDQVLFIKPGLSILLNGVYQGMSEPEGVQWSNVPLFDTRQWILKLEVDSDLLGLGVYSTPAASYATFADLINVFNTQLATYGSSFRLMGVTDNRILVANTSGIPLLSADPYFTVNNFNYIQLTIEDSVTGSDWMVKGVSQKNVTLSNVTATSASPGLFYGSIGCSSISLPVPIITLGENYCLQHSRQDDFNAWSSASYTSTSLLTGGAVTQSASDWAEDNIKVGISLPQGDYSSWSGYKPMIMMEVLAQITRTNKRKDMKRPQWIHPTNKAGMLNRTSSNYGGGDTTNITTEWDLTTIDFRDQIIEIDPHTLYRIAPTLPMPWVQFVTSNYELKYQRRTPAPTGSGSNSTNTFKQPIRFRFAYIDPSDNRTVILGPPSEEIYIKPKWGFFKPQDDTYVYDWQVQFNH